MTDDLLPSTYDDCFARDHLPPRELRPRLDVADLRSRYPVEVNAATEILDRAIERGFGQNIALRGPGVVWTYAELIDKSNRIADVLRRDLGLRSGGRVLLRGFNSPMLAACWFGVLKAGGVAVTTLPLLRARELAEIIERAQIGVALSGASLAGELESMRVRGSALRQVCLFGSDAADGLEARMAQASAIGECHLPSQDDVAIIAFTSGTTGQPKATLHLHRDLLAILDTVGEHVTRFSPDDVVAGSAPLGFTYGLGSLLLFPIRRGACSLLLARVSGEILGEALVAHGVTTLMIGPTLYRTLTPLIRPEDATRLRLCCSSGEALPASVLQAWRARTGLTIRNLIGSTEMLHAFIAADESAPAAGSLGRPLPGYEAEVFDADMRRVGAGVVGRLAVRGPTGCRYLGDLDAQRKYVVDGWNLTGDSALRDEHGVLWHHARTDEIIVSSGYNISGVEIENVLMEHSAVAACAVIGLPDPARGMVVAAFVTPRRLEDAGDELARALQDYVKAELAPYKYPRVVRFVDALPLTATGKIARSRLRDLG
jgi:2-aminobenzoate-CoA ligase